jgi:hypothetical protein
MYLRYEVNGRARDRATASRFSSGAFEAASSLSNSALQCCTERKLPISVSFLAAAERSFNKDRRVSHQMKTARPAQARAVSMFLIVCAVSDLAASKLRR